jgi:hypothetical protein
VLTEAAEIEHNLLCSYLYAAFSMKRADEPGLSEAQGAAVERWRKMVVSVALEEMAHLACVNNLLIAVGGAPHFDRPNLPVAPGYHPAGIVVRLTPFDRPTLDHFIYLERPDHDQTRDAPGFAPVGEGRTPLPSRLTPSALDYETVGELYDAIAEGFRHLAGALGEGNLIDPEGATQLDSAVVGLPNVPRVTSLEAALAAITHIKEEGEGSTGASAESHFDRFRAIRDEWDQLAADDPGFQPAWPAAHDPVMRKPVNGAERTWITAQPAAGCLDLGNALYGLMLQLLTQAFACADPGDQKRLMTASVELMEACAAAASALARLPASDEHPGSNAGLSFAVPRNLGFRRTAGGRRRIFVERVLELTRAAETTLSGVALEKGLKRLGNALAQLDA